MYLATGFMIGMLVYFVIFRIADNTCKKAGYECGYDCDKCTAHCGGYVCHVRRKERSAESVTQSSAPAPDELKQ
jgi:hypothetical protein